MSLHHLLEPASVAIIGASNDVTRIGGRTLSYLLRGGYPGRIVPVNPNRETVQGLPACPSIDTAPEVEAAIIALPAAATPDAVRACAASGVKACIVFSAGFAETGPDGAALEQDVAAAARDTGMRILGPNCLGLFTPHIGFYGCFSNTLDRTLPEVGSLSIVSQSGAFGTHLYYLARRRGLGLRYWISTGNECDVQAAEALDYAARDPGTGTILLYLEGARDGPALIAALETARLAGKPVIVVKVGRSAVGAASAASHTAALAGGDAIYRAVFRDGGAWAAGSAEEAVDIAHSCERSPLPRGRRLGIVTVSGGGGILIADAAADENLEVPPMPEAAQTQLRALLPYCAPRNPVDVTAQAFNRMDLFESNLEIVLDQGGYDAVIAFFTTVAGSAAIAPGLIETLKSLRARHPDMPMLLSMLVEPELQRDYEAAGFPVIDDPTRAVRAVAALCHFAESFRRPARPPRTIGTGRLPGRATEHEVLAILKGAGVPVVETHLCRDAAAALAAFRRMAGPVAMKISSPDIMHKTDIGGVILDVADEAAVETAFAALLDRAARHAPQAHVDGVLLSPMVSGHLEAIVGVENDAVFGPVVMFGLGGIFAEALHDVTFALAPLDRDEALAMIGRVQGKALLDGVRGGPARDIAALAGLLVSVSHWAATAGSSLVSLDINPVAVFAEGRGCLALDASLTAHPAQARERATTGT
ncbi:MAG: acetate--CoA ligase family protein [Hyphomicrobiales bacterium]